MIARAKCECPRCDCHREPFHRAVAMLLGQRWTEDQAADLRNLIDIGASPPREERV